MAGYILNLMSWLCVFAACSACGGEQAETVQELVEGPGFSSSEIKTTDSSTLYPFLLEPRFLNLVPDAQRFGRVSGEELELVRLNPSQTDALAQDVHGETGFCGGFLAVEETDFEVLARGGPQPRCSIGNAPVLPQRIRHEKIVKEIFWPLVAARDLEDQVRRIIAMNDRRWDNREISDSLLRELQGMAAGLGGRRVTVERMRVPSVQQYSVIVKIPGLDNNLPGVLLGAHLDAINSDGSTPALGADDDATGVASVIQIFRAIAESGQEFQRDVYLAFYAAEEVGLLGSGIMAETFCSEDIMLRGVMQLDMTGFKAPADNGKMHFVTSRTSPSLTSFTKQLAVAYLGAIPADTQCPGEGGGLCSDHASWSRRGYQTVFPFETSRLHRNPAIHSGRDRANLLDWNHALQFWRLASAFLVEMAEPVP